MTGHSGTITHSKSTVIIQRWKANLTVRIKWERWNISKTLTSLFSLHSSVFTSETAFQVMDMASHSRLLLPISLFLTSSAFTSSVSNSQLSQFFTCSLILSQTLTISHSIKSRPFLSKSKFQIQTLAASNAVTQSPLHLQSLAPPPSSTPLSIATASV